QKFDCFGGPMANRLPRPSWLALSGQAGKVPQPEDARSMRLRTIDPRLGKSGIPYIGLVRGGPGPFGLGCALYGGVVETASVCLAGLRANFCPFRLTWCIDAWQMIEPEYT